jgi:glucose/mannose-6-phosphate isomerase
VNSKTLVILSSFSGTTEEVLEAAAAAEKTSAKMAVFATGGPLVDIATKNKWPMYVFVPGELAKQPRLGLGFPFVGLVHLLKASGVLSLSKKDLDNMVDAMIDVIDTSSSEVPMKDNPAKQVAKAMEMRPVLVVAAEHLVGNAHILQNQIDESAKSYCHFQVLPELNHHFLESLVYPKDFFKKWTVLMIKSKLYHTRVQKRFEITADLFEKQGATVVEYDASGASVWEEVAEVLQFGAYASFYLSMLHGVEPQYIPFVKELKKKMK